MRLAYLCFSSWFLQSVDIKMELSLAKTELSLAHTFHDLLPYTQYRFFIQCSLSNCLNGWGALNGPLTGTTNEEGQRSQIRIFFLSTYTGFSNFIDLYVMLG